MNKDEKLAIAIASLCLLPTAIVGLDFFRTFHRTRKYNKTILATNQMRHKCHDQAVERIRELAKDPMITYHQIEAAIAEENKFMNIVNNETL